MRDMSSVASGVFSIRWLPSLAAAALTAMVGVSTANAGHGAGGDPYVFTNASGVGSGDRLWSNAANWNQPEEPGPGHVAWINFGAPPAIINYAAPSVGEFYVGQGGGDGGVVVTSGGSIISGVGSAAVGSMHLARDSGRNGTLLVEGTGYLQLGALGTTGQSSGGTLQIGHEGGTATATITNGTVFTGATTIANTGIAAGLPAANGSLTITGGALNALQIGVGQNNAVSSGGVGHLTIGGDATVNTVNHIFLRPGGRGNFTVDGSGATISLNRAGSTGFEVTNGSVVNFNADSGGFSTVNIPDSTMRFSGPDGIINVDATALGIGTYDLFTFGRGYFSTTATNSWSTENLTFAPGLSGDILYNANSIQLSVVPEPASLGLLAIGGLFGLRRRRRA